VSALDEKAVLEKYPLLQLDGALLVAEAIVEAKEESAGAIKESIGCEVPKETAQKWVPRIQKLIDAQMKRERERYMEDPVSYARSQGFDACAPSCFCGALAGVLDGVDPKAMKGVKTRNLHSGLLKKLKVKDSRQTPEERGFCLQSQTWVCSGDLRTFLDSH
jgi:hypothetical protein